jgi:TonB family protein
MKILLVATLVLAPVMIQAQAISPAQPQNGTQLQSKLVTPAFSATDKTAAAPRTSTGVVAPRLSAPMHLVVAATPYSQLQNATERNVTVALIVDAKGNPSNVKVSESSDPTLDRAVVEAVSQSRFIPGTVSNVPVAIPVNLKVVVRTPNAL